MDLLVLTAVASFKFVDNLLRMGKNSVASFVPLVSSAPLFLRISGQDLKVGCLAIDSLIHSANHLVTVIGNMTPNIVTAVTAAVCLLSLLTNANAGTTPWRRHQPSVSTFLNHSARARSVQKSLPIVLAPNRPPLQTTSSNPVIIHTTYNGHPINATVVRATPTPSINVNSTIRHDHGGTQFAEKPAAHHHTDMSIIPSYGNHTLFYTNRWKIANASAPFKQIHSTSAKKDGVHSCLKTCIQEANCAFAGFSQRGYSNSTMAIAAGKNVSLTTHLLNTTCSLYSTVVNGVGELVATHVNEKVSLGPEFLAVVGDRVAEEKLRRLLGDRVWWRSGEGRGASNGIFHGHDGRAVEVCFILCLI